MRTHRSVLAIIIVVAGVTSACRRGEESSATKTTSATAPAAAPAAVAKSATKDVDLAPLPLKLTVPSSEEIATMDKSFMGTKSVGVSIDLIGLNVSESAEKTFDAVKKSAKADKVLFPFKKWVRESSTTAIEEFSESGKTGYIAWSWKVVGGKPYLCQSAGLSGLKSVEDAENALRICDTLASK